MVSRPSPTARLSLPTTASRSASDARTPEPELSCSLTEARVVHGCHAGPVRYQIRGTRTAYGPPCGLTFSDKPAFRTVRLGSWLFPGLAVPRVRGVPGVSRR